MEKRGKRGNFVCTWGENMIFEKKGGGKNINYFDIMHPCIISLTLNPEFSSINIYYTSTPNLWNVWYTIVIIGTFGWNGWLQWNIFKVESLFFILFFFEFYLISRSFYSSFLFSIFFIVFIYYSPLTNEGKGNWDLFWGLGIFGWTW